MSDAESPEARQPHFLQNLAQPSPREPQDSSGRCGYLRVTLSTAVFVVPFSVAVTVELVLLYTLDVVTVKVADVAPAATVTLLGTFAADVLLLDKLTVVADGAAALSVTVPVELEPPVTLVGFSVRELSVAVCVPAVIVRFA